MKLCLDCQFNNKCYLIIGDECEFYQKEKNMEELKITKDKVLSAADKHPLAKEVLKELFPEVFEVNNLDVFTYDDGYRIYYNGSFYAITCHHCSTTKFPSYIHIGNLLDKTFSANDILSKILNIITR